MPRSGFAIAEALVKSWFDRGSFAPCERASMGSLRFFCVNKLRQKRIHRHWDIILRANSRDGASFK